MADEIEQGNIWEHRLAVLTPDRLEELHCQLAAAKELAAALAAANAKLAPALEAFWISFRNRYSHDKGCCCVGCTDVRTLLADCAGYDTILATLRREAKREALREWRAKFGHYVPGENTILDEMDAALTALAAEEADHG